MEQWPFEAGRDGELIIEGLAHILSLFCQFGEVVDSFFLGFIGCSGKEDHNEIK